MMQHDALGLLAYHVVGIVAELFLWNVELLSHRLEHDVGLALLETTELHDTEQKQRLLARRNLAVQIGANRNHNRRRVKVGGHLVGSAKVTIKVDVGVGIANTEMVTKIADKHGLSPCLVNLLFFAKQGKQAKKTR